MYGIRKVEKEFKWLIYPMTYDKVGCVSTSVERILTKAKA